MYVVNLKFPSRFLNLCNRRRARNGAARGHVSGRPRQLFKINYDTGCLMTSLTFIIAVLILIASNEQIVLQYIRAKVKHALQNGAPYGINSYAILSQPFFVVIH